MKCPCGSAKDYQLCCGPYHKMTKIPATAEELMRSRYSAYTLADMEYINNTMQGKAAGGFDIEEAKSWAKNTTWIELKIIESANIGPNQDFVEFMVHFIQNDRLNYMHERSEFHRIDGRWFYVDGVQITTKGSLEKIGRNTLCPCNSKKKYKNCHQK